LVGSSRMRTLDLKYITRAMGDALALAALARGDVE
jgi:hypothetical protein